MVDGFILGCVRDKGIDRTWMGGVLMGVVRDRGIDRSLFGGFDMLMPTCFTGDTRKLDESNR